MSAWKQARFAAKWTFGAKKVPAGAADVPLGTRSGVDTEEGVQDAGRDHTEVVHVEDGQAAPAASPEVQELP